MFKHDPCQLHGLLKATHEHTYQTVPLELTFGDSVCGMNICDNVAANFSSTDEH